MIARSLALFPTLCALAIVAAACTGDNPNYCDRRTPCGAGDVCDVEARRCVPDSPDASPQHDTLPSPDSSPNPKADAGPSVGPEAGPQVEAGPQIEAGPQVEAGPGLGSSCKDAGDCASGFCVEGVCCESACTGTCLTCASAQDPGRCVPAAAKTDPRKECGGSGACAGSCDGSGACAFPDNTQSCGTPSCSQGELSTGACDAKGACTMSKQSCGGLICADASSCKSSCVKDSDCMGSGVACIASTCTAVKPLGATCGTNGKLCASGNCVDGVCCDSTCGAACHACNLPGKAGTCSPEPNGTSCGTDSCTGGVLSLPRCSLGNCQPQATPCAPYTCSKTQAACGSACAKDGDCVTGAYCDANNKCKYKKENGISCGGSNQCKSGLCTSKEKVCCDRQCGGDCESCTGRSQCTFKPAGTSCGSSPACIDDPGDSFISRWSCSGSQSDCQQNTTTCGNYKCGVGLSCLTSCAQKGHDDCVSGVCRIWSDDTCEAPSAVCHVDASAASSGNGSLATPYKTISPCLTKKAAVVAIADGTYDEDLTFTANTLVINIDATKGASFPTNVRLRPTAQGITVNSGAHVTFRDIYVAGHSGASGVSALLRANGDVTLINTRFNNAQGDAISGNSSTLTCTKVRIDNPAQDGIDGWGMTLSVDNLTVDRAGARGIYLQDSALSGKELRIFDSGEVGLDIKGSLALLNLFSQGNTYEGLVARWGSSGYVTNLLITNNKLSGVRIGAPVVLNYATITNNNSYGVQLECGTAGQLPTIHNSIIWSGLGNAVTGYCVIWGSDFDEATATNGNYSATPQFVKPSFPPPPYVCFDYGCLDYRLGLNSPCMNQGIHLSGVHQPSEDIAGRKRFYGSKTDSGAYEDQGTSLP